MFRKYGNWPEPKANLKRRPELLASGAKCLLLRSVYAYQVVLELPHIFGGPELHLWASILMPLLRLMFWNSAVLQVRLLYFMLLGKGILPRSNTLWSVVQMLIYPVSWGLQLCIMPLEQVCSNFYFHLQQLLDSFNFVNLM